MSSPVPPAPGPAAKPAAKPAAAVIRKVQGAGETAQERLLKKHLPAWVVSGVVHVALIGSLIALDTLMPKTAAQPKSTEEIAVVTDDKQQEEKQPDLTNPDEGLNPELEAAVDVNMLADTNVVNEMVAPDQPVGVEAAANIPMDFIPPPGISTPNAIGVAGAAGDLGNFMSGEGLAGTGAMVNQTLAGRSAGTRNTLVQAGGGNEASEAAVARGLIWLAKQQRANGSWVYDGSSSDEVIASTGMALLPFLAAGQTHNKPGGENKYQQYVARGLAFLIANQKPDGSFKGAKTLYAHGIASVALCEAFGMTGDRQLLAAPAQKAISYLVAVQGPDGSWGYGPNANGDTSIVGWQIQALQSAKLCKGLVVEKKALDKARAFLDKVSDTATKSKYGYSDRMSVSPARSAIGLLCRYYVDGWGPTNSSMVAGVDYLLKSHQPSDKAAFDMYYYYYATQVMHFYDGPEWRKTWNPAMRDLLITRQVKGNSTTAGSWDADRATIGSHCGRLGTSCMALLTLEVYYRHLPTYKRGTGGLRELER